MRKKSFLIMAGIITQIVLLCFSPAFAEKGFTELSAPEVKQMIDKGQAVLINTMSAIEFEMQYIPGSINIPIDQIKTTDKLPKDKNYPIIFHCMGKQ
jgi:rhodanese-related sulfurtransferase